MVELAAKDGYARASISQVVACARVSRSTYYQHFADKHACFVAAHRELSERLLGRVTEAAGRAGGEREATDAVLGVLIAFAAEDTPGAQVLLNEALAAGGRARDRRDELVRQIAGVLERAWGDAASRHEPRLDVAPGVLAGGALRLVSIRILRGPGGLQGTLPDLRAWAGAYTRTGGTPPSWRTPDADCAGRRLPRSPYAELPSSPPPEQLPPGRRTRSASEVSSNRRERILRAGADAFVRRGYTRTTVADIVAAAHLTRAVFYEHFHDKRELFMEIQQIYFHQLMAVSARAFFSAPTWPERVWEGIRAISDLFAENPRYAHIGTLESHAAGSESLRHAHDAMMAFAVFLEEGHRQRPEGERLPALCSEAIASALIETVYLAARTKRLRRLPEQTPGVVYLALAPFLGPERAGEFVESKLREA
jgi:AcrR family transcriptional regulator